MRDLYKRKKLIVQRMEERLAIICRTVPPIQPGPQYWLDSDCGPSYCRPCVIKARGEEFELGAPLEDRLSYYRTEAEDAFYEGIDGGFDCHGDSTGVCELCGSTLSYILSDEGVASECDYYRESPLVTVRDEDSYALDRLALNIWAGSDAAQILSVCIAVNQAFRLVRSNGAQ